MNETFILETLWNAIASPFVILSNKLFGGAAADLNVEAAADLNREAVDRAISVVVQEYGYARIFCVNSILYGCFFGAGLMLSPVLRNESARIHNAYSSGWLDSWKESQVILGRYTDFCIERSNFYANESFKMGYDSGFFDCSIAADNIDQCAVNHTIGMGLRF